ncbi:MAG: hypothetical protein GQ538_13030 [Xanthomonadales bacterium]|nr:hypothetical protein [Xanthomonadales bacterium]
MKYPILILLSIFLLINAPDIRAHNLITVNGNAQNHQHEYRRQQYGKPLQQGHLFQSGGASMIIWGSGGRSDYGKSQVRRSRSVIENQYPKPGAKPNKNNKYGSTVSGYGKAVNGYGKLDQDK